MAYDLQWDSIKGKFKAAWVRGLGPHGSGVKKSPPKPAEIIDGVGGAIEAVDNFGIKYERGRDEADEAAGGRRGDAGED